MKNQNDLLFKKLPGQQFEITVLQVRRMEMGNLRALIDVRVGPFTIKGVRVVQQDGQAAWVTLPQQQDKNGNWWPIIKCDDKELENSIKDLSLDAWKKETQK